MKKDYLYMLFNMESSLKTYLNYSKDEDIADIDIDNLIAIVLLNYLYDSEKDKSSKTDLKVLTVIIEYYEGKEYTVKEIKNIISELDNKNITSELFKLLFSKFILSKKTIDDNYILKSYDLDEIEGSKILENKEQLKMESERINKYLEKSYNNFKNEKDLINKIEIMNDNSLLQNDIDYEINSIKNEIILNRKNKDYQIDNK